MTATQRKHLENAERQLAVAILAREIGDYRAAEVAEAAAWRESSKAKRIAREG